MSQLILIPSKRVEILKQQARKLSKSENIPRNQALDRVAQEAGFDHWHHVTQGLKAFLPTEEAYKNGCIVAMDVKAGLEFDTGDGLFVEDWPAWVLCKKEFYAEFINSPDEEDPEGRSVKDVCSSDEIEEWFQEEVENLMLFRLTDSSKAQTAESVIELVRKYAFWAPRFFWLKGKYYDCYALPSTDDNGNIVGVRL